MLPIFANALKGRCPNPTQFLYQPSAIEIVLDLVHQAPSCCYDVHPESSAHGLGLYQFQNFKLVIIIIIINKISIVPNTDYIFLWRLT